MNPLFNKEGYWRFQSFVDRMKFKIDKFLFGRLTEQEEQGINRHIFYKFVISSFPSILLAFIVFLSVAWLEYTLTPFFKSLLQNIFEIKVYKWTLAITFLPNVSNILSLIKHSLITNIDDYRDILTTSASIIGVYVGLYYTTLSVLATTVLESAPDSVRSIILNEKVGNFYIRLVTFVVTTILINLIFLVTGFDYIFLNFLFISFLVLVSLRAFIELGISMFSFLDPKVITKHILTNLYSEISKVGVKNYFSKSRHFQSYHQKVAEEKLISLGLIIDLIIRKSLIKGDELKFMVASLVALLNKYTANLKKKIPSDSYWYKRYLKHGSWYLTDWIKEELSFNSKVTLTPDEIPDHFWLEDIIVNQIFEVLKFLLKEKDYENAYIILNIISDYYSSLGKNFDHQSLSKRMEELFNFFSDNSILSVEELTSVESKKEIAKIYGIVDTYPFTIIKVFLGFLKSLDDLQITERLRVADDIIMKKSSSIYNNKLSSLEIEKLEPLMEKIIFESKLEKPLVTTKEEIVRIILDNFIIEVMKTLRSVLNFVNNHVLKLLELLIDREEFRFANIVIIRILELHNKIYAGLKVIKGFESKVTKISPTVKFSTSSDIIGKMVSIQEDKVFVFLAEVLNHIDSEDNEYIPDYFGTSINFLYQKAFDYLLANKDKKFKVAFEVIFSSTIKVFSSIFSRTSNYGISASDKIYLSTQPFFELVSLSGYAILASKVFKNNLIVESIESNWDRYLNNDKKDTRIEMILRFYSVRKSNFKINKRDSLQHHFQKLFNEMLLKLKIISTENVFFGRERIVISDDPLLNVWVNNQDFIDSQDIFIYERFKTELDALKINIRSIDELKELLENETKEKTK